MEIKNKAFSAETLNTMINGLHDNGVIDESMYAAMFNSLKGLVDERNDYKAALEIIEEQGCDASAVTAMRVLGPYRHERETANTQKG
jgi:hypothetical protein